MPGRAKRRGVTAGEYARRRGVSLSTVNAAKIRGAVVCHDDGSIDPEASDRAWTENTHSAKKPDQFKTEEENPQTFVQARTANEVLKAKERALKVKRLKGELLPRSEVVDTVHRLARQERDAWINWPARVSATLAAGLGVDAQAMHAALARAVREHLAELSQLAYPG